MRSLREISRRITEVVAFSNRLGAAWPSSASRGIMHGDFAPENVLVQAGRLSGVVDWEQCREGDPNLDLVGILFDLKLEANAGGRAAVSPDAA